MTKFGEELIAAMGEALAFSRGEAVPGTRVRQVEVEVPDVRALRRRMRLSRARFAERFGLEERALQDWEQGRRRPDRAARTLLRTIERHPEAVAEAVAA